VSDAAELVLTAEHDGALRGVVGGQDVHVVLPEIPTSGYLWDLQVDGPAALVDSRFEAGGAAVGAAGTRHFVVRPAGTGRAALRAVLRQAWNPAEPAQHWSAALDVSG
jgi:predicted secreted protein